MAIKESEKGLLLGEDPNDAMRALMVDLGVEFTEEELAQFSTQELLDVAHGDLRINRNPTTDGRVHLWLSDSSLPPNGHDYI